MGKKLFVGNLAFSIDQSALEQAFSACGTVESAVVITDRDSGRSKGFGFVEMSSEQEAGQAIEQLNGKEMDGRAVNVSEAKPQAPRSGGFNKRGGGGFDRGSRY